MTLPIKYVPPALAKMAENKKYGLFIYGDKGLSCIGAIVFVTLKQALNQIGANKWYIVKVNPQRKILYAWNNLGYWELTNTILTQHKNSPMVTTSKLVKDVTKIVETQIHKKTKKKFKK